MVRLPSRPTCIVFALRIVSELVTCAAKVASAQPKKAMRCPGSSSLSLVAVMLLPGWQPATASLFFGQRGSVREGREGTTASSSSSPGNVAAGEVVGG